MITLNGAKCIILLISKSVFFNLVSEEPRGSAKFLTTIFEQTKLLKIEQKRVYI
jgi:hypothetical protein